MAKKKSRKKTKVNEPIVEVVPCKDLVVQEENSLLPAVISSKDIKPYEGDGGKSSPLVQYLREISRYQLLSKEQEAVLTKRLFETGDVEIAKRLVTANLRLVVKLAMDYRFAYPNVMDLIQEGNIGLMKAVSKYDPNRGAKLSYYASWWIKSYILKFILDNFRLVKIGTTNEQKKLFYNLVKEKNRLESKGIRPDAKAISNSLGVSEKAVVVMEKRLGESGGEVSLDKPFSEGGTVTIGDTISSKEVAVDDDVAASQELSILTKHMEGFLDSLKERDREIFKKRLLNEMPLSLQMIANEYGVSRERIRQIEERLLDRLKVYMSEFIR